MSPESYWGDNTAYKASGTVAGVIALAAITGALIWRNNMRKKESTAANPGIYFNKR